MVKCKCGAEFASRKEFNEHYVIGKPTVPIKSKYTSKERIDEAKKRLEKYNVEHHVVK